MSRHTERCCLVTLVRQMEAHAKFCRSIQPRPDLIDCGGPDMPCRPTLGTIETYAGQALADHPNNWLFCQLVEMIVRQAVRDAQAHELLLTTKIPTASIDNYPLGLE